MLISVATQVHPHWGPTLVDGNRNTIPTERMLQSWAARGTRLNAWQFDRDRRIPENTSMVLDRADGDYGTPLVHDGLLPWLIAYEIVQASETRAVVDLLRRPMESQSSWVGVRRGDPDVEDDPSPTYVSTNLWLRGPDESSAGQVRS
jgi:hypothetical protein